MKKIILYIGAGILIFIIGLVAGLIIANFYFKTNKEKVCSAPKVNFEITPEQIKNLTSLTPGRIIYGDVKSKEGNQITLVIPFSNPSNPQNKKNIEVNIPIDPKDEIIRDNVKASLNDIKINDYLVVKILEGKKIIYLSTIK